MIFRLFFFPLFLIITHFRVDIYTNDRIKTQFNLVRDRYAKAMDYRASDNDPDKAIWNKVVETVKNNPSKYFYKNGNWRKNPSMDDVDRVLNSYKN